MKLNELRQLIREEISKVVNEENPTKTTDKSAERFVKSIIRSNPRFKWLHSELPNNYTLADVKEILEKFGYAQYGDKIK